MFSIPKQFYDAMILQAQAEHPNECCGLLAGKDSRVSQIYKMTNTQHSPINYLMDPREQFVVFKEMRKKGLDLLAIYHSHPHTQAYPSKTDVRLAYYPEAAYLILSLEDKTKPVLNAYRISTSDGEGTITPETFEIR
jgi:[CysO sulfur-carrier protein]-S-L-cysteine hydrolase